MSNEENHVTDDVYRVTAGFAVGLSHFFVLFLFCFFVSRANARIKGKYYKDIIISMNISTGYQIE